MVCRTGRICRFDRMTKNGCCMYQTHFQLHRMLFQGGDRSRQFYRTQSIREVSPRLLRGLRNSLGPCLLTARQGAGRTALLRQIQRELEHDGRAVLVSAATVDSPASLLKLILHCIARPTAGVSNSSAAEGPELTHWGVIQHLQKSVDFWGPVFLLLDDIHLLAPTLLNELRALSEEEWQGRGLVRILATAPLSFEMQLGRPEYQSFAQRLCCHEVLAPLTASESLELLRLEIESAGGRPEYVFSESAATLLASASEGLPRQLSLLTNEALTVAAEMRLRPADDTSVRTALRQIQHLSLTWNLPASAFDDDADANHWHQSQTIESPESASGQTLHWTPGIVEVGAPVTTPPDFNENPEPLEFAEYPAAPEAQEIQPTSLPLAASTPQTPTPTIVEPVTCLLWDPDCADFSSILPVKDRCSEPLNYGLISGHMDVFEIAGLQLPPVPPAAADIPELRVSDSDVMPVLETAKPPESAPAMPPVATEETIDEGILRLNNSGLDLFHAYSGRRLVTAPPTHTEHLTDEFSTRAAFNDSPISVPLWRDGSLLGEPSGLNPSASETTSEADRTGNQQPPVSSDDSEAEATARFANLFTRLRKLQSRDRGLQGMDGSGDSTDGAVH